MNIILFDPPEVELPLPRRDPRAVHLLEVLRRGAGDEFDAGLINGPVGRGTLVAILADSLLLRFVWGELPPPLCPIHVILGLPRPQTARDILRDATTLGVAALHFFAAKKGERTYAQSKLWRTGEWRQCVINGAAQAFDTRLPEVRHHASLADAIAASGPDGIRVALDNYEATSALDRLAPVPGAARVLALGPERGWADAERQLLRAEGFTIAHLGRRVLRTETACVAAVALLKARFNPL